MNIQCIRHGTHVIYYGDKKILIDPVLSPKGSMSAIPGVENQNLNPLVDLPVETESLLDANAILLTHLHRDHFDDMAASLLSKECPILCPPSEEAKLKEQGFKNIFPIERKLIWQGIECIRVDGTHGTGESSTALNPVSGYVLQKTGEPTIYISGDSVWCSEMKDALQEYKPQWMVCFGGAAQYQGDTITMGIEDFKQIRECNPDSKLVVLHMEAWNHCVLTREELRTWVIETGQDASVFVPEDGAWVG